LTKMGPKMISLRNQKGGGKTEGCFLKKQKQLKKQQKQKTKKRGEKKTAGAQTNKTYTNRERPSVTSRSAGESGVRL